MLRAAQADALGAEPAGARGVVGRVRVGVHVQAAAGVRVAQEPVHGVQEVARVVVGRVCESRVESLLEVPADGGRGDVHLAEEHLAGRPVDRDDVPLVDHVPVRAEAAGHDVDVERVRADDARAAHAAGDDGGVRRLAAPGGQHADRGDHAAEVVGVRLAAHQHHVLALGGPLLRRGRVEDGHPDGRPRRGRHPAGEQGALGGRVELREQQLRELLAGDARERLVERDQVLVDELRRDPERRGGGALAHPRLQHPQPAALDRELDVAQVPVVRLELAHRAPQVAVRAGVDALEVGQGRRVPDPRDDVLALRVRQVVAVVPRPAGRRVARERHPGARRRTEVAEHHRHHVDRRAQVVRDPLLAAVQAGALGVPRPQHRHDREVELLARLLREVPAGVLAHDRLEHVDERAQVVGAEVDVRGDAARVLGRVEGVGEPVAVDVEHGPAEHLHEPAVGVPREPLVAAERREPVHRLVVEAYVEDRLHHPGHRELGPGPHGHQQRVGRVAEAPPEGVLHATQGGRDLDPQAGRHGAVPHEVAARLGRDREPRRHRQPEPGHLGQVRALAAQQVLLVLVALGEVPHVRRHGAPPAHAGRRCPASGPVCASGNPGAALVSPPGTSR